MHFEIIVDDFTLITLPGSMYLYGKSVNGNNQQS